MIDAPCQPDQVREALRSLASGIPPEASCSASNSSTGQPHLVACQPPPAPDRQDPAPEPLPDPAQAQDGPAAGSARPGVLLREGRQPSASTAEYLPEYEPDMEGLASVRFDEPSAEDFRAVFGPAPIQLETWGVTSQFHRPIVAAPKKPWQIEFWANQTIHKNTVAAKLRSIGATEQAKTLEDCHSSWTVQICNDCGLHQRFPNRCDSFFCPECQPRLSNERRRAVEWWANLAEQPKHVVLTLKNVPHITKGHIQEAKKFLAKLRRRKFARNWKGGFCSIEVTNEGKGWHVHFHLLIDAKWIDENQLRDEWDKSTNHMGRIVRVKDARRHDYLAEVTKYAVKGSQLAAWSPEQILEFITAFTGVRTFSVFGSLYGARTKFAEFIATLKNAKPKCPCGSCNVRYMSETDALMLDLVPNQPQSTRPPPPPAPEPELALSVPRNWVA